MVEEPIGRGEAHVNLAANLTGDKEEAPDVSKQCQ